MRIACLQISSRMGEPKAARVQRALGLLDDVEAELVVLPELWAVGYFRFRDYELEAEPLDGPTVTAIREMAARKHVHIHGGSIVERREDGRLSNTSFLVGPDGEVLLTYRKRHLFGYRSAEARLLSAGEDIDVVATPFGVVGMTTCYDLRFPELYRALVDRGVELVLVASAWPQARLGHWLLLTRTRALENQVHLVACNAAGLDAGVRLAATIDRARLDEIRAEFPVLEDRVPTPAPQDEAPR